MNLLPAALLVLCLACGKTPSEEFVIPVKPDPEEKPKEDLTRIKVMSFNCLTVEEETAAADEKWAVRKPAQIKMFKDVFPDLAGLQECQLAAAAVEEEIPEYGVFKAPYSEALGSASLGPIILYKKSRVTVLDSGHFWLGETPDVPCKPFGASDTHYRIATWIKCLVKGCQDTVYFYNTHFPYKSEDHPMREKCSELMISRMKENARTKSICFLTGDLNQAHFSSPGVPHANAYCLQPLFDWMKEGRETAPKSDEYGSHSAKADAAPLKSPNYDLDHIFYRNTTAVTFRTIVDTYGVKYLSDHYPIVLETVAKFSYTGNPEDDKWDDGTSGGGSDDPVTPDPPVGEGPGISCAADFIEFAAAVNSGASTEKWQNEEGAVALLGDIDMASVTSWTPIGADPSKPFTGVFDGGGFSLYNFKYKTTADKAGWGYGLFGTIGQGAQVKNLSFHSSCSLDVTATAQCNVGLLAGIAKGCDIRDVSNSAPVTVTGKSAGKTYAGGLLGYGFGTSAQVLTIDSATNNGLVTFLNGDANEDITYKGYTLGGIVGFLDTESAASSIVSESKNTGEIGGNPLRSGGIAGTASKKVVFNNCENHGVITNSFDKKWYGRAGGIACSCGANVEFRNCRNYGDITQTKYGGAGAILCEVSAATITVDGGANYGKMLSAGARRGLVFGTSDSYSLKIKNFYVDGKVGSIAAPNNINNPGWDSYQESESLKYLGYAAKAAANPTVENITFAFATDAKPAVDYENAKLKILFIGNSFTLDAVNRLPGFISAAGLDGIQMTHMYYGGRTIPEYCSTFSSAKDYSCFQCGPGRENWFTETGKTLEDIVKICDWDIITIQEHTGTPSAWYWEQASSRVPELTEKAAVEGLVAKIKAACPNKDVKIYYLLSQAYGKSSTVLKNYFSKDQSKMFTTICDMAKKAMDTGLFAGVISTAAALQNLRGTSLNTDMDLTRDTYHMDYGRARFTASELMFESLISTSEYGKGVKLDNTTYRVTENNTESGTYCSPVDDAAAKICLKAARAAIEKPFEVTKISE